MKKLVSDGVIAVKRAAVRGLSRIHDKETRDFLRRKARKGRIEERIEALESLFKLVKDGEEARDLILKITRFYYPSIMAKALDFALMKRDEELVGELAALADDRSWMVRSAFYRLAGKVRKKSFVPMLIGKLGREKGRLEWEAEKALESITGMRIGVNKRLWEEWWRKEGESFVPRPEGYRRGNYDSRYGNIFYGVPVYSNRVVFLLDVSGSMETRAQTGWRTRLELAKEALIDSLMPFSRDTRFNIITFSGDIYRWSG